MQKFQSQKDNKRVMCNCLTKLCKVIDRIDKFEQNCQIFIVFRPIGDISWRILDLKTAGKIVAEHGEKFKFFNFWN